MSQPFSITRAYGKPPIKIMYLYHHLVIEKIYIMFMFSYNNNVIDNKLIKHGYKQLLILLLMSIVYYTQIVIFFNINTHNIVR